jgi:hypothetical protein
MRIVVLMLVALLTVPGSFFAEPASPGGDPKRATGDDSAHLGAILDARLTTAYHSGDWAALEALVAPDYLGITEDFEWDFASLKREFPKIRLIDSKMERQRVKRLASDLILVNDVFTMHETFDGEDISGRYCTSNVWVHRNGRWLLLVEQEVRLRDAG